MTTLVDNSEMLQEYFSIVIGDGCLVALPELLAGYFPESSRISDFLFHLAIDVGFSENYRK